MRLEPPQSQRMPVFRAVEPMTPQQQRLVESCQGLVRSIAWKIHQRLPKSVDLDDLIAYGNVGLVQAARDFDPERATQFTTYAYYRVRGEILNGLSQMSWFCNHKYYSGAYEQGRSAVLEVAATDSPGESASTDAQLGALRETAVALSVAFLSAMPAGAAERIAGDASDPADDAVTQEMAGKVRQLLGELDGDAAKLMRLVYYESNSLAEAARTLGISRAWACRLHGRTLRRLGCALGMIEGKIES